MENFKSTHPYLTKCVCVVEKPYINTCVLMLHTRFEAVFVQVLINIQTYDVQFHVLYRCINDGMRFT
jgi:hypothetical protein